MTSANLSTHITEAQLKLSIIQLHYSNTNQLVSSTLHGIMSKSMKCPPKFTYLFAYNRSHYRHLAPPPPFVAGKQANRTVKIKLYVLLYVGVQQKCMTKWIFMQTKVQLNIFSKCMINCAFLHNHKIQYIVQLT